MNFTDKFPDEELEWRVMQSGLTKAGQWWAKLACYVTARAVCQRFDDVCGNAYWRNRSELEDKATPPGRKCTIEIWNDTIKQWVGKEDGAEFTDIESYKGGFSKSLVRAGSVWGVGRYLYDLPVTFAKFSNEATDLTMKCGLSDKSGKKEWVNIIKPRLEGSKFGPA